MVSLAALSLLLVAGLTAAEVKNTSPAIIEDFPSVVQIEVGVGPVWVQACVGTIVTNFHILTAAHCFFGRTYSLRLRRVKAGATYRGRDGEIRIIERVTNHPDFNGRGLEGDISVLRLSSFLTFGDTIQSSPIVGPSVSLPVNVPVTFAGWGRTAQDVIWANRQLSSVNLRVVSQSHCEARYATLPIPIPITNDMICVAEPGALSTNIGIRDTGAPLFFDGVLAGVLVFGSPVDFSLVEFPLVATSVSGYSSWIVANAV